MTVGAKVAPGDDDDVALDPEKPRFLLRQFLQQLPIQFTAPLCVPCIACVRPAFSLNLLAVPKPYSAASLPSVAFFTALSLSPFVVIVAWALSPPTPSTLFDATLRSDFIHVVVALVCMRLAICYKYAFMAKHTYASRLTSWASRAERSEEQLITGWMRITPELVHREVRVALAARHPDGSGEKVCFSLHRDALPLLHELLECDVAIACVNAALAADGTWVLSEGEVGEEAAGSATGSAPLRIPVAVLVEALLLSAAKRVSGFTLFSTRLLFFIALVGTFTTTVLRATFSVPVLGYSMLDGIVIVGHWGANIFFMGAVYNFLLIGAVDFKRRARAHKVLAALFSPGSHRGATREPLLVFDSVGQARAFLDARALLLTFGAAYHERLVLVTSSFLVVFSALAAYCIVAIFTATSANLGPLIASFILLHVLVLPAFACCALGLNEAAGANTEARHHVAAVVNARVHARLKAADAGQRLDPLMLELLADVEDIVRVQGEQEPIMILSHEATNGLTQSLVAAWTSIETVAVTAFANTLWAAGATK